MKDGQNYAGVGAFFLFGAALLFLTYNSLTSDLQERGDGYEIKAIFDDLLQLRRGDQVRMSGVIIGVVTSTELEGRDAIARMSIDPKYQIPADSTATIKMAGLLGTNYISVNMGESARAIEPRTFIQTRRSFDINLALEQVGEVAGSLGGAFDGIQTILSDDDGDSLFANLGKLVSENRENLTETLKNIRKVSDQISSGEGTVGKLIFDEDAYRELEGALAAFTEAARQAEKVLTTADHAVAEAKEAFADLRSGSGVLGALIYDEKIASQFGEVIANIAEFSDRLNTAESTITKLLTEEELYLEVRSVVRKAGRTLDSLSDSAPISAVGVAVGALF
ncbi:MAG: MlaD family protein [Puniceicoccaceae bacterium]